MNAAAERVAVLASDGDINIGVTVDERYALVVEFRERDIFLSSFGYGRGNCNHETAQKLSSRDNGNYACIDSPDATRVACHWLIGYEHRLLNPEDLQAE